MPVAIIGHITAPASPDEFASTSRLYHIDPRAKLLSAIVFAVAVSLMTQLWPLVLAFVVSLIILSASGLKWKAIYRQMRLVALFILMIALPIYIFKGFEAFLAMILRVSSATIVLLVMVLTTASADLANGLRRIGVPKSLVLLLSMTYRYLFLYGEEAARMSMAREARGIDRGKGLLDRRVLRTLSSMAGLILVKAHMRGSRISRAMRARGYTGDSRFGRRLKMGVPDASLMAVLFFLSVFLLLVNWGVLAWTPL